MKKILRLLMRLILWGMLGVILAYCWLFFPIMSGYVAKRACSEVFVAGRSAGEVRTADFSFPFSIVSFRVDSADSSVSASILGVARRKAIYRQGLGSVLISGCPEAELRGRRVRPAGLPGYAPDTVAWPIGDRVADTLMTGVDHVRLDSAVATAFTDTVNHTDRGTRAVLVVYKGQIVAERYAPGFTARTPMLGWSIAKSVTNAMLGVMVRKQGLDIRSPAPVPAWQQDACASTHRQQDPRAAITWQQLMQMTSGLRFHWFPAGPSDVTNMLFKEKDMAAFAAGLPLQAPPGTRFLYSDGNANILCRLIRDRLGDNDYYRFPYEEIFYKTGMLHTTLETDAGGSFVGSSWCYGTARDWARFGLLYLNDGVSNGQRILPEGWVQWTTSPSGVHNNEDGNGEYGALFWVNAGREGHDDWRRFHRLPLDAYSCQGFEGQYIIVIPSKKLIVVRLSLEKGYLDPGNFAADVAAAFAP